MKKCTPDPNVLKGRTEILSNFTSVFDICRENDYLFLGFDDMVLKWPTEALGSNINK